MIIVAVVALPAGMKSQPRRPAQNAKAPISSKPVISSFVIASGGGTSAAGSFSVTGTIGQAAAGPAMTGANFSITSGFWAADTSNTPAVKKQRGQITSQD